jgi:hypothetical protein
MLLDKDAILPQCGRLAEKQGASEWGAEGVAGQ